ncbi:MULTISPECIES: hypothetical protein [unclassified Acinetobacter]|uniref:hypothetical protein n=1 Tax=unclassified Acinetobacter TaxID=196816 RepID=UPI0015D36E1E|nr:MULTISPECIES: hypothetical protein [unclassified Acinetobacter]
MTKQTTGTVVQSVSLPHELTLKIDKAWHRHTRSFANHKVSRSKFIAGLIEQALKESVKN